MCVCLTEREREAERQAHLGRPRLGLVQRLARPVVAVLHRGQLPPVRGAHAQRVGRVASGGAHVVDGELRAGSPGGGGGGGGLDRLRGAARGGGGGGGERPRWVVPARGLQAKERMTARERVFQAELAAKRGHLSGGDASPSVMARKGLG